MSEFALALVLLVAGGLLMRSFLALLHVDPGFDRSRLFSVQVSVTGTRHEPVDARTGFFTDLTTRVAALPGVEAVSAINHVPLKGDDWHFPFSVEGRAASPVNNALKAAFLVARPGYFRTMGIRLLRGREFSAGDITRAAHVVIVNAAMARHVWPNDNPVGRRISVDDPSVHADWFTVIGVAADVKQGAWSEVDADQMYFPYVRGAAAPEREMTLVSFLHPAYMTLVARSEDAAAALTSAIQSVVRDMDVNATVSHPATMEQAIDEQFATPRFYGLLIGSLAAIALFLAAVGVFGVISYSVARRSHEIGVRLALGADARAVLSMVVAQGVKLALTGAAIGTVAAFGVTRYLGALLYRVPTTDPLTFAAVVVILMIVAMLACWIPARRALGVSPVEALRAD